MVGVGVCFSGFPALLLGCRGWEGVFGRCLCFSGKQEGEVLLIGDAVVGVFFPFCNQVVRGLTVHAANKTHFLCGI